ncbi:2Fe-2S iron-sulfur cluster-binding protein [Streptomyces griseus]|uniref:2Fe-2S iron-sulfur cluster-binding protein n=1 Tax=Streptomyces griseus TaxID=1911 RepID=UPI00386DBB8D|nr:2Fe-2S iron-sulfur cluster-binding protein [Streptomyces griseus]WTD67774.1 2Fe-2S iron-sulfur cluster-binding protein [Streptomyces griseus]
MSNEENPHQQQGQGHSEGPDPRYGGWEPTPQGDGFDADATAFVHLPPEDLANIPLAAPGHGYVPPMIVPLTPAAGLDPAATGSWVIQTQTQQAQAEQRAQEAAAAHEAAARETGAVHWPDPNQQGGYQGPYQDTSHATAQWNFTEALGETPAAPQQDVPEAPGASGGTGVSDHTDHTDRTSHTDHTGQASHTGHTGQWTIPVADGDLPDESGEFLASAHTPQWYADSARPATLPGGAPAPWATPEPEAAPVPMTEEAPEPATEEPAAAQEAADTRPGTEEPDPAAGTAPEIATGPDAEATPETESDTAPEADPETEPLTDSEAAPDRTAPPTQDTDLIAASDPGPDPAPAPALLDAPSEHPSASYLLHVNGVDRPVSDAWIGESLLYVLRERLGLAGAKDGCSQGECGACNVQVDGRLVASCLVPAATAAGSEVRTVEGLAVDGEPSDVQRALSACGAVQCGFCIPGMAMTVHDLLEGNHAPSELETRQALCGNLCRCSGYRGVLDAVADVVAAREANAEAATAVQDEARIPHQAEPGAGGVQQVPHPHEGEAL